MNWLGIAKGIIGTVVTVGVGNIVGNAVAATTPAGINTLNKISIQVGTFVLSGLVATQAVNYVNAEIDSAISQVQLRKESESQE
jgi:hypothetical protein